MSFVETVAALISSDIRPMMVATSARGVITLPGTSGVVFSLPRASNFAFTHPLFM